MIKNMKMQITPGYSTEQFKVTETLEAIPLTIKGITVEQLKKGLESVPDDAIVTSESSDWGPSYILIRWAEEQPDPPQESSELEQLKSEVNKLKRLVKN